MSLPAAQSAGEAASRRLRIMHVVNYLRRGGAELGILKLMGGLNSEEFEHRICTTRSFDPDFVQVYGLGSVLDVAAGTRDRLQFPLFRLRRIFRRFRPHIVHTRNWGALEAVLAARLAGVPIVIHSEHGYEVDNMTGLPFRQRVFRRLAYSMADRVFTLTRELREYHSKQAWISPERIGVVYNGVDTDRFCPRPALRDSIRSEFGLPPDRLVVGSVGRVVPIKDYPTLLDAAERLSACGVNLHVLLVGKGPERESLERRVRESSLLCGRVSFVGESDRVPELLNAMDVFVLTSLGEGMSNTLLEAMASGVPLVATRAGGNPEVVGNDLSEWLFTSGDAGQLTARLESLAKSAELRSHTAEIGRKRALADFSLVGMMGRYRDLYVQAAAERGVSIPHTSKREKEKEQDQRRMPPGKLKLVILTASDSEATCRSIQQLAELSEVEICGILLDNEAVPFSRSWRNLRRNVRREGISYLWYRLGEAICETADGWAARVVSHGEVEKLLENSFPERAFSLADVTRIHGIPVLPVGNLNSRKAVETLRELNADLGVVLGTRILKRSTFAVPRLGSVNLHKGKVPEYRGQPAGFWEVYDGRDTAGVTVHFVDDGLDTGDVVGETSIAIHPKDSPESLRSKLDIFGSSLLAKCVSELARGTAVRRAQKDSEHKARTSPTQRQRRMLKKKLDDSGQHQSKALHVVKTLYYLVLFHSGAYRLVRAFRRTVSKRRGCILLYHRVNNFVQDPLTTGVKRFAEHLVTLRHYYPVVPTARFVSAIGKQDDLPSAAVAIHFDDCYRDVYLNAARLLAQLQMPACAFISSGFIGTDRVFPHDAGKCPIHLENLNLGEVAGLVEKGFEIGSHTVNHVDLGQVSLEEAENELVQSKRDLESILGMPMDWVSYPYGRKWNIRPDVVDIAKRAGYKAMFSAYGGYVNGSADLFDIQRIGMSGQHRPLDLLMDIEGLSLAAWKRRWTGSEMRPDGAQ